MPISKSVTRGEDVNIIYPELVNLYGCEVGAGTFIGPFVEVQSGVRIGRHCKIQSHTFICSGVTVADEVFVGHGVMFTNDKWPAATNPDGSLKSAADWTEEKTYIGRRTAIGSNATLLPVKVGQGGRDRGGRSRYERRTRLRDCCGGSCQNCRLYRSS